jgi:gephyrin
LARDPLPPFPASIKDGYAVIAEEGIGEFEVVGSVSAGKVPNFTVTKGTVAKITTGAPIPEGANAVVMIEDTVLLHDINGKERVRILKPVSKGQDIRPVGSDIAKGDVVLKKGVVLGPAEIGILATVGTTNVSVVSPPTVAVLSTGDELVPPDCSPGPGQIRDSNRSMLIAAVKSLNNSIQVIDLGICPDNSKLLEEKIVDGLAQADVLLTSGGVSVGDFDLIQPILAKYGHIHFGRILMKPGKPLTFATITFNNKKKLAFGLPGNPVSSLVTFQLFGIPSLRKLSGYTSPHLPKIQVKLSQPLKLDPQRPEYHRATIHWDERQQFFIATSTGQQASSRLLSMRTANALLLLPQAEGQLPAGTTVTAFVIGPLT